MPRRGIRKLPWWKGPWSKDVLQARIWLAWHGVVREPVATLFMVLFLALFLFMAIVAGTATWELWGGTSEIPRQDLWTLLLQSGAYGIYSLFMMNLCWKTIFR